MTSEWRNGWTTEDPPQIGFVWRANTDEENVKEGSDGFTYRTLYLGDASNGKLGANRLTVSDAQAASSWRAFDIDFDFIYILQGSATLENQDGEVIELEAGSAATQPGRYRYRLSNFSADFDAIRLTAPADVEPLQGHDANEWTTDEPRHRPVYSHDAPDQYVKGDGPREFFLYRDLGPRAVTDGRIHIHLVRAKEAGKAGTGWHIHSMAQWFLPVRGSGVIWVEDHFRQRVGYGDSVCIGRGPNMRHDFTDFTHDYAVVEMCVPADYETIPVDKPDGVDAE
jgi:uncharacterized cupin superfamily protein